jgi:oligopeptide transport system substrate-binding protein
MNKRYFFTRLNSTKQHISSYNNLTRKKASQKIIDWETTTCLSLVKGTRIQGQVAQLVEQRTENPCVGGSIPSLTTKQQLSSLLFIAGEIYLPAALVFSMKYTHIAIIAIISILFFPSCKKEQVAAMHNARGGKKYGGRYTINEIRGNPSSLDPVRMNSKIEDDIANNIYDRLIDNNNVLDLVPELAKSWEISPDGKNYTLHLRSDAYFHDDPCFIGGKGRKFVANDAKYSLERVCDPKTLSVGFTMFSGIVEGADDYYYRDSLAKSGRNITQVTGFHVPDDTTFVITLVKPFGPFLEHLATSYGFILPKEAVEKYGKDFFRHPIGTGAFAFDHWSQDEEIVLKRNPKYWQFDNTGNQLPFMDEIRFTFIKDDKTLFANFERGVHDENITIPTEFFQNVVTPEKKLTPEYEKKYQLQHVTAMNSYFIDVLCTSPQYSNMALRRAMSFAIDRGQIVKYILKNAVHGPAENGIVPPAFKNYPINDVHGISFNTDSARYWLKQSGFGMGGKELSIILSVYNEPRPLQIANAVQNMWQTVLGAKVDLHVMQASQLIDESEDGKLDLWVTRWYADYPEVENFLNLAYGKLLPPSPSMKSYPNSTRWNNDQFNIYFEQALQSTNDVERNKLYAKAENIMTFESPAIPLFYEDFYRLLQPWVRDNPLDPMNRIDLKWVWLDK